MTDFRHRCRMYIYSLVVSFAKWLGVATCRICGRTNIVEKECMFCTQFDQTVGKVLSNLPASKLDMWGGGDKNAIVNYRVILPPTDD